MIMIDNYSDDIRIAPEVAMRPFKYRGQLFEVDSHLLAWGIHDEVHELIAPSFKVPEDANDLRTWGGDFDLELDCLVQEIVFFVIDASVGGPVKNWKV